MKIIQVCLTCVSFLILPTFGTTNYTCPRITKDEKTYSCSDTNGRKVTLRRSYGRMLEIVCLDFQKLGAEFYNIFDALEHKIDTFAFEQCRIPDVPFVTIFQKHHYDLEIAILYNLSQSDNADYFRSYHFENLTFITALGISGARIELSKNIFDGIPGIRELLLHNTSLQDLPSGIFKNLTLLNDLEITYNKFTMLPADSFSDLTSLEYLTIDDNKLTTLPNDLLKNHLNLTEFSCKGNRLTTIPENMFENNKKLWTLDFSFNRIERLDGTLFYALTELDQLNLAENRLTFIGSEVFVNLHSLTELDLSNNFLNGFEPDTEIQGHSEATIENSNGNYSILDKNLFANLKSVKTLFIDYNNLTFLPKDIFKNCEMLEEFSCKGNRLKTLPAEIFEKTQNLNELDLSKNLIESLPDTLFYSLESLTSLNLAGNRLKSINSKLFANLYLLKKLDLTNNNLNNFEEDLHSIEFVLLPNIFGGLQSLVFLSIDYNNFTTLPKNLIKNSRRLKKFSCEANLLTVLPSKTFILMFDLEELNLSYNKIESLHGALISLRSLINLNLSSNHLQELGSYELWNQKNLQVLDLSKNLLNEFDKALFLNLGNIIMLDLSSNQLAPSTGGKFKLPHLSDSLKTLLLRNNSLTDISLNSENNFKLRLLDLSQNNLTSVTLSELLNPTESINVYLDENQITTVITGEWKTKDYEGASRDITTIAIHLRHNPIKCDCHVYQAAAYQRQKYIEKLTPRRVVMEFHDAHCNEPNSLRNESLHDVDLYSLLCPINDTEFTKNVICPSKCRCHYRPADVSIIVDCSGLGLVELPDELPKLDRFKVELRFSNNKLASLDKLLKFASTVNINSLSLSNNHLTEVHQLEFFNNLKNLELDNNQITRMSSTLIRQLENSTTLTSVTLHNNPWECDCSTKDFIEFVKFEGTKKINHSIENITCKNSQQSIKSMTDDLLCYESDQESVILIILYVSLALLGILCIVITMLYFKFQYEIKVWMFKRKIFLRLVTRTENNEDKTYDAFITISKGDEAFVFDYLTPQLENDVNHAYKLFIESRDYVIGGWIPNQISDTVQNSGRSIIVLSNNYLNNEWRQADFRASRLNAFKEHDPRVIVILLDEINTENLDTELKDLLQNTTLKWGDTLFWEKLKYELPHPQINSERHRATDTSMPLKRRGFQD